MPELPEVETIKRELNRVLVDQSIVGVDILWPKTVAPETVARFTTIVTGKKILSLGRRAKMLLISLSGGIELIVHLKMTGQLIFVPCPPSLRSGAGRRAKSGQMIRGGHPTKDMQTPGRHTRLIFRFKSGDTLYFNDLRKFGWVRILDEETRQHLAHSVGIEPLSRDFSTTTFRTLLERFPNRTVKQILLDQQLIAGIGNIYADEAAYRSGILPMRKIRTLDAQSAESLRANIVAVLKLSVAKKGTSSRDYRRADGTEGGFLPYLNVYGRKDLPCRKCGTPIIKTKHAGRGTHYCPKCQK